MPNYVTNIIRMEGKKEDFERVLEFIASDDAEVDFNRIIPMPKSLNVTAGSLQDQSIAVYNYVVKEDDSKLQSMMSYPWVVKEGIKTVKELSDYFIAKEKDIVKIGEQYVTNIELYGCPTWYEWCNRYWGTKWNAGEPWTCEDSFGFETAWSSVPELLLKLSEFFPEVTFNYSYADEDFGSNLGRMVIKDGEIEDEYYPPSCSDEAYDFAAEILGYDAREDWDEDEEDEEDEE